MKTAITEAQVRARLSSEPTVVKLARGERAWDPIAKRGWSYGPGTIDYHISECDPGFIAVAFDKDDGRGSDLHFTDYAARCG
jgi:hypothetical protein